MHPTVLQVTQRIAQRSAAPRRAYLERVERLASRPRGSDRMGCANVAHAFAALPRDDKLRVVAERAPNIGIVTAYNDMLSAHQPYEGFPALIRDEARALGATAQVAGGVPAMCDGVTQGLPGMELSLFSRDTIAMGTAIALTPRRVRRRAAARRVRQDRAGPADRRAALRPPAVRVRAGRADDHRACRTAKSRRCASSTRRAWSGREALLEAEMRGLPRRRHLHLLRHRQQQPDAARGDGPARAGRGLRAPARRLREALTREAVRTRAGASRRGAARCLPIGRLVDERVHRQRDGRAAGHRGLDQPPDPLGGGGARRRHPRSTGPTSPSCRRRCRCWRASTPTAAPT